MFSSGKNPNVYSSSGIDPYFNETILLLHGDGTNSAGNTTYTDNSLYNDTLVRGAGTNAQGSFSPYSPAGWSMYMNAGLTDYLTVPNINFSTNNFTIEGWFYYNIASATSLNLWGTSNGTGTVPKLSMYTDTTNINVNYGGTLIITAALSTYISVNRWIHIALSRTGTGTNQTTLYINGVAAGSGTTGDMSGITGTFNIGYIGEVLQNYFPGWISNFRIVNGTAVYTGAFTPSTTNLTAIANTVLLLNLNRWYDASGLDKVVTVTGTPKITPFSPFAPSQAYKSNFHGGSLYSSVATDYVGSISNTMSSTQIQYALGGNDFTIEGWFYPLTATTTQQYFFNNYSADINQRGIRIGIYNAASSPGAYVLYGAGSATVATYMINRPLYTFSWNHVAVVRQSNMLKIFQNGVMVANFFDNTSYNVPGYSVGTMVYTRNTLLLGYTSDIRISKTAVYTTKFTPPQARLSPISYTDTSSTLDLYVAQITPSNTGYFGLSWTAASSQFSVTTGFCIEFWINFNTIPDGDNALLGTYPWSLTINQGNIRISQNQISWVNPGYYSFSTPENRYTFVTGRWYHIAFIGSTYNYVAVDGDVYNSNDAGGSLSGFTHNGTWDFGNRAFTKIDAYVRDFRVITGNTVYFNAGVANFTRPSAPLGIVGNGTTATLLTLNTSSLIDASGNSSNITGSNLTLLNNLGGTANTLYSNKPYTVLLLNFNSAGVYDSTGKNVLFLGTAGTTQVAVNTSFSKFGGACINFPGTLWIRVPDSPLWDFAADEWMIDFWLYLNANTANYTIISKKATALGFGPFQINTNTTGKVVVQLSTNGTAVTQTLTSTTTVPASVWTYIAVYKYFDGTNYKVVCSINGADGGGALSGAGNLTLVKNAIDVTIGNQSIVASQQLNGGLDEFRVTRSARGYTTTSFPPTPTKAFPDQ